MAAKTEPRKVNPLESAIDGGKANYATGTTVSSPAKPEKSAPAAKKAASKKAEKAATPLAADEKSATSKDVTAKAAKPEKSAPAAKKAAAKNTASTVAALAEGLPLTQSDTVKLVDEANTYQHDADFLNSQKEALLAERATYLEQANSLREEADSLISESEPGDIQFDEESGEGGTATVDRERDLALSAQALAAVEEINYALHKIEIGKYGICESCGQLIVRDRLEALPYARLCVACKSGGLSRR